MGQGMYYPTPSMLQSMQIYRLPGESESAMV